MQTGKPLMCQAMPPIYYLIRLNINSLYWLREYKLEFKKLMFWLLKETQRKYAAKLPSQLGKYCLENHE